MPKKEFGYRVRNGHMGGRSKNLCSVEVAAVVDLSLDDVDTDDMDLFLLIVGYSRGVLYNSCLVQ